MTAPDRLPLPQGLLPPTPPQEPAGLRPPLAGGSGLSAEWQRLRRYAGGALLALCFALFGWQAWRGREPVPITIDAPSRPVGGELRVQVTGAVVNPGVYHLTPGDRIEEAVRAAGGFAPEADTSRVNLAQRVRDEQRLEVPLSGQPPPAAPPSGEAPPGVPGPGSASQTAVSPAAAPLSSGPPARVNVNSASAAELEALPGIGPVTAQRILELRVARGPIRSLEQLRDAGIPEPLLRRAAGRLSFE